MSETAADTDKDGVVRVLFRWMRSFGREFMVALLLVWIAELLYSIFSARDIPGAGKTFCILWFSGAATFFIGAILGFLFGVPKSRKSSQNAQANPGYVDNNNLEEISDWVTKIVVGLSLVEFKRIALGLGGASSPLQPGHRFRVSGRVALNGGLPDRIVINWAEPIPD